MPRFALALSALLVGLFIAMLPAQAVPARPGWLDGRAGGEPFQFQLTGDEFVHWAVARDGHTVLMDEAGVWRHARHAADGGLEARGEVYQPTRPREDSRGLRPDPAWLARQAAARRQEPAAGASRTSRVEGQWNLLLILIRYPNQLPLVTPGSFADMMNQPGWHGTGSFNDYYLDMSYGRFSTLSTVTAWVQAAHPHDYYGYNQGWERSQELVIEAVLAADPEVDFSQFDNDGNGVVDGLLIVHSGHGAEEGNSTNIWSHRWGLWGQSLVLDGVTINDYTMQPELQGGAQSAIGVYVHEFGHALNLPDLYDTDYSSSGVGSWCVMSGGSWGGGGSGGNAHVPSAMSAWCRQRLGWSSVTTTPSELVDYGLPAIHLSDEIIRLDLDGSPQQFFLCENRRLAGWDLHQPAAGLFIWHVDENQGGNSDEDHFLVDLEQADGMRHLNLGMGADAGDIFPGQTGNRTFNAVSNPASLPYGGGSSSVSVTAIGDAADTLVATFFQYFSHQDLRWVDWQVESDSGGDNWPDAGEEVQVSFLLTNHGASLDSLRIELAVEEAGIAVLEGLVTTGPVAHGQGFATPPFRLALAETLPNGRYPLTLRSVDAAGWEQVTTGAIQVGRQELLLLLDGADASVGSWYETALNGSHSVELRVKAAGAAAPQDLAAYPLVIWACAASPSPLSSADLAAMGAYLAQGGQLLLTGQRLLDGVSSAGRALLGADPGSAWSGSALLRGWSEGGLLADQESILLAGAGGAWNQQLPATSLQLRAGSILLARWGTGNQGAILRREDAAWAGGRLIVAGVSLEAVHGGGSLLPLSTVLERFLGWLENGTLVGVAPRPLALPQALSLEARPNPFNPDTHLRFVLAQADEARLQVWNMAGALVREVELGRLAAGSHDLRLDLGRAASGLYLAELRTGGGDRTHVRLLLLR
ncbi:MAG: M6 family metalloprotease domain-containing protein [bacterium]|nr:M6 family metalloprotease domain-containing protein [bacterium]